MVCKAQRTKQFYDSSLLYDLTVTLHHDLVGIKVELGMIAQFFLPLFTHSRPI